MSRKSEELTILKQMFGNLSERDKQSFIDYLLNSKVVMKEISKPRDVKACPHCGSVHFIKTVVETVSNVIFAGTAKNRLSRKQEQFLGQLRKTSQCGKNTFIA